MDEQLHAVKPAPSLGLSQITNHGLNQRCIDKAQHTFPVSHQITLRLLLHDIETIRQLT